MTHRKRSLLMAGLLVLLGTLSLRTLGAANPIKTEIEGLGREFASLFAKKDVAALTAMYSADAMVFPPEGQIVRGTDAIGSLWQGFVDSGARAIGFTVVDVERCGDFAHEVGTYVIQGVDGKELDRGKYVVIWKRQGKTWRIQRDIWNTSVPPTSR